MIQHISQSGLYQLFFNSHPDAIYTLDLHGKYTDVNPAGEHLTGYSRDEMLNLSIRDLIPTDQCGRLEFERPTLRVNEAHTFETAMIRKDGRRADLQITRTPLVSNGEVIGVMGVAKDITVQKLIARQLQNRQKIDDSLKRYNPNGICLIDLLGQIHDVNPAYEKIIGYSTEELLQMNLTALAYDDTSEIQALFHPAHEVHRADVRLRHQQGRPIDVNVTSVPVIIDEEILGLHLIIEDMSLQKQVKKQLEETESRYALISENSHDVISITTFDGTITYMSPSVKWVLGYSPEELIGLRAVSMFHPQDIPEIEALAEQQKQKLDTQLYTGRVLHKDGHYVWMETTSRLVRNGNGNMESINVGRDITERRKADELLLKSELLSGIGQLAAGVAHEIRNPLTAIKGFLQMMHGTANQGEYRYFQIMKDELERIERILSEMLVLAKPQAHKFVPRDVGRALKEVVTLIVPEANLQGILVETDISDALIVQCDSNQIKQVFLNVIMNGIEAMSAGGSLHVTARNENGNVCVILRDEGVGISPENLSRLGEPFYTTKETGTGLGLMMCHRIVSTHRGTFEVTSEVGVGTTVRITFPSYVPEK